jgi:hypothetical protein
LPPVAPESLLAGLQGRKAVRQQVVGSHRCSSAEVEVLHRSHTQLRVRAGSDAPGVAGAALQDTVAFANCFGSAMAAEDRTALRKAAVTADRFRPCAVRSLAQSTGDARFQQYVLSVGKENEALTWEGMDSLAVQTGLG